MAFDKLHILPIAVFVLFPATFLITYIVAVLLKHVEAEFPYISDTGTYSPESCVFGQLLNFGTMLMASVVYVRFQQVQEYFKTYPLHVSVRKLNKCGVWFGLISCLGLSFVANFQETNVITVHLTGAFMCFGFGTLYFWVQAICSYYMQPLANSIFVAHLRLALAMICSVFFILLSITGVISHLQFHGANPRKWYPVDGGWELHVISTVSEWIVAIAFCIFILSFSQEFQSLSMEAKIVLLTERVETSDVNDTSPFVPHTSADEVDVIVRQSGASHSVVIIASSQAHCNHSSRVESPDNSEGLHDGYSEPGVSTPEVMHSARCSRPSECGSEQSSEHVPQVPHSVVIIAASQECGNSLGECNINESEQPVVPETQQESDILPSKLLSLSLSLLVAAFFQAIRCLQELIEDTFRTLHCDLDLE
ncbi:DNA damage-regulated autophagy modulator protein 2 [Gryllus bimaculatus]|nr:DNA damage-regulated autophagy modulator protein 2 [Gryllus bimaculatus]